MKNELLEFIVKRIQAFSGEICVIEPTNAPRPTAPYTSIRILTTGLEGSDFSRYANLPDVDMQETIEGLRIVSLSINTYGTGAHDRASRLCLYLRSDSACYEFMTSGVGVLKISNIRNLEYIESNMFKSRYQFDVDFSIVHSIETTIRTIEDVEIQRIE